MSFIQVRNLRTFIDTPSGQVEPVAGVDLDVAAGETLGVVGETGSGKSQLVRAVMGLLPRGGSYGEGSSVVLDGHELTTLGERRLRDLWGPVVAFIPQDPATSLNPVRKVGAQIVDSLKRDPSLSRSDRRDRAVELFKQVGIADPARRLELYPHEMSGGMRQRVLIASAISLSPRVLIADEPTTALDVTIQRQILDLISELQESHGTTVILVSHDLGVVAGRSDRVAVMYAGRVVELLEGHEMAGGGRHPYTNGLLRSQPSLVAAPRIDLPMIDGEPPSIRNRPSGCAFAPRCRNRVDRCASVVPPLVTTQCEVGDLGLACFNPVSVREAESAVLATGVPTGGAVSVGH